jgi:L-alanine-DL-glutamate epimerase-like enolase superfamily enzyme
MRITHIEPIVVALPMTQVMKMAGVEIASAENLLVRIESDDGVVGWGESASAPTMTGETPASMLAAVQYLAPALLGEDAAEIGAASARMDARMYGNQSAKAAIEIALHDLVGHATGKAVWELLGKQLRSRVPALWMLGTGNEQADLDEAARKKAAGFVSYKIKVGVAGVEADARRTARICELLSDGALVSADANQGYDVEQALAYVRAVEGTSLAFLEQPVRADDLEGMARVAQASRIPIGADEGLHCLADIREHHAAQAASGGSLKLIKLGGLRPALAAARLCETLAWKVNLACKVAESSIATAAVLHLAAVVPSLEWGTSLTNQYLADDLASAPIAVVAGYASVPQGLGLGIEVDEARVREYRLRM